MESLVVTLETAKKLKAAGFWQQAQYHWHTDEDGLVELKQGNGFTGQGLKRHDSFSAPSAQEIIDQLPQFMNHEGRELRLEISPSGFRPGKYRSPWLAYFDNKTSDYIPHLASAPNIAEALALLWIDLQEAKLWGSTPTSNFYPARWSTTTLTAYSRHKKRSSRRRLLPVWGRWIHFQTCRASMW
ncbi:hypothetical protein [Arthrobacter sp. NicSoilC5]|uniref:hypothetical protein n=1 Tax=Arthrobacter sp. NicSoilC5 TaxID=2831000 RepID=UPI001CC70937|nr:hypothetical protein [Arthrobacter sp. NicSoilC5]